MVHSNSLKNKSYKFNIRKHDGNESISVHGMTETPKYQKMKGGKDCEKIGEEDPYLNCIDEFIDYSEVTGLADTDNDTENKDSFINQITLDCIKNYINNTDNGCDYSKILDKINENTNENTSNGIKILLGRFIYVSNLLLNIYKQNLISKDNKVSYSELVKIYVNDTIGLLTGASIYNETLYIQLRELKSLYNDLNKSTANLDKLKDLYNKIKTDKIHPLASDKVPDVIPKNNDKVSDFIAKLKKYSENQ